MNKNVIAFLFGIIVAAQINWVLLFGFGGLCFILGYAVHVK